MALHFAGSSLVERTFSQQCRHSWQYYAGLKAGMAAQEGRSTSAKCFASGRVEK